MRRTAQAPLPARFSAGDVDAHQRIARLGVEQLEPARYRSRRGGDGPELVARPRIARHQLRRQLDEEWPVRERQGSQRSRCLCRPGLAIDETPRPPRRERTLARAGRSGGRRRGDGGRSAPQIAALQIVAMPVERVGPVAQVCGQLVAAEGAERLLRVGARSEADQLRQPQRR